MAMLEQVLHRKDGSEVKIVAQAYFGLGLTCSIGAHVLYRESQDQRWKLANDRPAPGWREMSVDEYVKHGRPEMFQKASHGEILKVTSALAAQLPAGCRR